MTGWDLIFSAATLLAAVGAESAWKQWDAHRRRLPSGTNILEEAVRSGLAFPIGFFAGLALATAAAAAWGMASTTGSRVSVFFGLLNAAAWTIVYVVGRKKMGEENR